MPDPVPFLSVEDRVEYFYRKGYFLRDSLSEDDVDRLSSMNFHYFLGYAMNFRELHNCQRLRGAKLPSRVFRLIDVDSQVSEILYSGIRNAEWLLRHFLVQEYCQKFDSCGSFLDYESYLDLGGEYTNDYLAYGLMTDILEYNEAFVVERLSNAAKSHNQEPPRRCKADNWELCRSLCEELPLWSVVDSFSLGRLVKLIQRCDASSDDKDRVWRAIAGDMGIPAKRFPAGMESLRSLRNLVAHQSRLWMRPTTSTPKKEGLFHKKISQCHKKAMLVAFYNVASFQGSKEKSLDFARRLEAVIDPESDYKIGISCFSSSVK